MDEYILDNEAEATEELERRRREGARMIKARREELTRALDAYVPDFTDRLLTCIKRQEVDDRLLAQMEQHLPGFTKVITTLIERQMDASMAVQFLICEGSLEHPEKNAVDALRARHEDMVLRSAQMFEQHSAS